MKKVALEQGYNDTEKVFCGYLRQPIDYRRRGEQVLVNGYCALDGNKCFTTNTPDRSDTAPNCPFYQLHETVWKLEQQNNSD